MAFRWKLALAFTLLSAAVLAVLGAYLHWALLRHGADGVRDSLLAEARRAASALPAAALTPGPELQRLVADLDEASGARVTVMDAQGAVLADSRHDPDGMDSHANRPERLQALTEGWGSSLRHSQTLGVDMLYVAVPLSAEPSKATVLRLSKPLTAVRAASQQLRRVLVAAFVVSAGLICLTSLWLAGSLTEPIRRLVGVARRVEQGDLAARVPDMPASELGEVGDVFNSALERLGQLVGSSQRESRYYSAILEQMTDGVVVISREGRVEFVNAAFARMFGIDGDAVRDKYIEHAVRTYELSTLLTRAVGQGTHQRDEFEALQPRSRLVAAVATPLLTAEGQVTGAVGLVHDLTELHRADQVRRDFVANASHELRTPAAAIKALAEALQAGALQDQERAADFVGKIVEAADRLAALLEDMLTLTRVERGGELLKPQWLSASEAFADAIEHAAPAANAAGVPLRVEAVNGDRLYADAGSLQTVLMNLLDNAIKYTPQAGRVTLSGEAVPGGYEISVADTGIGIPEEHIPRIFERFYRVDAARGRAHGGTGLGLSIVKHIAEAHGGKVSVRSTPGEGSTFSVFFPQPD